MAIKRIAGWHQDMAKRLKGAIAHRGNYDEIISFRGSSMPGSPWVPAKEILDFFRPCLVEERCHFDNKMRGDAVNHDLYAYSPRERVAIVQARHAFRRRANHFLSVHKTYFLVGYNEVTKAPFRHPISANTVRAAVRKHGTDQDAIVRACQAWMFDVTPRELAHSVRQGDVLLTPLKDEPQGELIGTVAALDNHVIEAAEVRRNGALYARDLKIRHTKGQHREVMADGWHRVVMAREVSAWSFSQRLGD
jgi:hypothetical protein